MRKDCDSNGVPWIEVLEGDEMMELYKVHLRERKTGGLDTHRARWYNPLDKIEMARHFIRKRFRASS